MSTTIGRLKVPMSEIMKMATLSISVEATGVRRTSARLWLGGKILRLAAAVIGCKIEVDIRHEQ